MYVLDEKRNLSMHHLGSLFLSFFLFPLNAYVSKEERARHSRLYVLCFFPFLGGMNACVRAYNSSCSPPSHYSSYYSR